MEKRMSLCIEKNGEIIGIAGCEEERMEIEFVVGDGECVIDRMRDYCGSRIVKERQSEGERICIEKKMETTVEVCCWRWDERERERC